MSARAPPILGRFGPTTGTQTWRRNWKGYNLESSEEEAEHLLILDRHLGLVGVTSVAEGRRFLEPQHPPGPSPRPERANAFPGAIEERIAQGWSGLNIDPEQVQKVEEQRTCFRRLMAYLDHWPHV